MIESNKLYTEASIKVKKGVADPQKVSFEPNSVVVFWSLLNWETRLHLKFENSVKRLSHGNRKMSETNFL